MRRYFISLIFSANVLFAISGEDIFNNNCASCHQKYVPFEKLIENFEKKDNKLLNLKAPTLNQLSFRLKTNIGDPKGDTDIHKMEVVEFISDYSINPNKDKSVCLKEVINYFETMPSLKGKISDEDLELVSEYIYDFDIKSNQVSEELNWLKVNSIKNDNRIYLVEVMSDTCYYCKNMDKTVFSNLDVIKAINSDFVPIRINKSIESMDSRFRTSFVPSFYFYKNGKIIKKLPGAWKKNDFISILKSIKESSK